jgi:pyruvate dehydrogenase E2 component (dihydrolipoamide acetyltransferase)/2-oxoisovalerate dehydrogenase E2 component (dihydrolipoyl transacylase)
LVLTREPIAASLSDRTRDAVDFHLPPVGEGLFEVELVRWLVRPGESVRRGQGLAEVMSDKATMEVPAPFAGTITALVGTPGTKVKVGQLVLTYDTVGSPTDATAARPERDDRGEVVTSTVAVPAVAQGLPPLPTTTNGHGSPTKLPPAAPSVRLLARKLGIDLARVHGTGPGGRILIDDLTPLIKPRPGAPERPAASSKTDTSKLDFGVAGTRQKLIGLRRRIAEHVVEAKRHIPHYSYVDECDLSDIVRLRAQLRDPLAAVGVKLTYLAFFVKAAARALKEVPIVNSTFDEVAEEVTLHDRYNIGIAVAAPQGLVVPVVKNADKKDLTSIAMEIDRLSSDAKAGRSKLDDLKGSTFTVTSVGGIGGLISTPIINHPEVGIMGVGKVVKRPVYDANNNLRPADIVFLSFSFDHRIVDGAIGAAFANAVLRYLLTPALLLLPEQV